MRRLLWTFGWVTVVIWSVVCALAYGLFDLVGRLFMRNADVFSGNPETVESIFKFFSFLRDFSTGGVLIVWGVTSLLILAVPWAFDRLIGPEGRGAMQAPRPRRGPAAGGYGPGGVIDLGPDQYSVGPTPGDPGSDRRTTGPLLPPDPSRR